jgi:Fe-S cluster assembly protein SufD
MTADGIAPYTIGDDAGAELVFVNGLFAPQLSHARQVGRGVQVDNLEMTLAVSSWVQRHLARYASIRANPFVALNTAFLADGAAIHLDRNTALDRPIHVLHYFSGDDVPAVAHPRVLLVLEEGASAQLLETWAGSDGAYWTNAVTEVVAGDSARVEYCKLVQEGPQARHLGTTQFRLGRAAELLSTVVSMGGQLVRNDVNVVLDGQGAAASLNGLTVIADHQHVDNHTLLDHAKAQCPSRELYKAVLADHATGVFKGKILVRPDSQKTDSKQTSRTLLLSDDAAMNSQPALEIYADDVKCTHGSTTGPLDEEQVFYLRSRGVELDAARHMLIYAFAAQITGQMGIAPARRRIEGIMAARHGLPSDMQVAGNK